MTTKQEKLTKYTERAEKLRAELAHANAMESGAMYRKLHRVRNGIAGLGWKDPALVEALKVIDQRMSGLREAAEEK